MLLSSRRVQVPAAAAALKPGAHLSFPARAAVLEARRPVERISVSSADQPFISSSNIVSQSISTKLNFRNCSSWGSKAPSDMPQIHSLARSGTVPVSVGQPPDNTRGMASFDRCEKSRVSEAMD
jgi:hypothetical protein|eukprot:3715808-Prymnesium_polylepis.2